jgi:hypothetical protein
MPSTRVTKKRMNWSATRKKIEATATMMNTMRVVMAVSRLVGHVTFWASVRTSCKNLNGLIFAIVYLPLSSVGGHNPLKFRNFFD